MKIYIGPYPKKANKERKIRVHIDGYDVWSMDYTLALIIAPMLRKLKEDKQGAPFVDDEDVPEELKSTNCPPKENEWDTDDNFFKRWDYILDEMIFSFESYDKSPLDDEKYDRDSMKKLEDRIKNGLRLFAKYYGNLWN
jgi:hypothetical protein